MKRKYRVKMQDKETLEIMTISCADLDLLVALANGLENCSCPCVGIYNKRKPHTQIKDIKTYLEKKYAGNRG